ncbi:MAG: Sec-independent protein secretion pathway component TatC [Frankiales bacterium]|nr:Sec-independent protein secretion pathway component TatC [Frankiales bacterium]
MPLIEHILELRRRIMWSLVALTIGIALTFVYWEPVYDVLRQPYCDSHPPGGCKLYAYGIFDQFNTKMRVAFIGGAVLSSPVWLYQLGAFITPALHKRERRYAGGFLAAALILFGAGVAVAYVSLQYGLHVLLHAAGNNVQALPALKDYLSFVTLLLLVFGLAFEFPVVLVFLNVAGVLSYERMRSWRRVMYFCLFAAAAILTPSTDPFQFLLLGIPLCLLYETCVLIARTRSWLRGRRQARDPLATLPDDEASYVDTEPSPL